MLWNFFFFFGTHCPNAVKVAPYCLALQSLAFDYSSPDSVAEKLLLQTSKSFRRQQSGIQVTAIFIAMATRKEVTIGYFGPFEANNINYTVKISVLDVF